MFDVASENSSGLLIHAFLQVLYLFFGKSREILKNISEWYMFQGDKWAVVDTSLVHDGPTRW